MQLVDLGCGSGSRKDDEGESKAGVEAEPVSVRGDLITAVSSRDFILPATR